MGSNVLKWKLLSGLVAVLLVSGCTGDIDINGDDTTLESSSPQQVEDDGDGIGEVVVEENLFSVEVTLPKDFFDEMTEEELLEYGDEQGFSSTVLNPDGSVTVKMSRSAHNKLLEEMREGVQEYIDELTAEAPRDFTQITYEQDMTFFRLEVNRSVWPSSFEVGFASWGLAISGIYYQMFAGIPESDREVVIEYVDAATGEVFDTEVWPGEDE